MENFSIGRYDLVDSTNILIFIVIIADYETIATPWNAGWVAVLLYCLEGMGANLFKNTLLLQEILQIRCRKKLNLLT